MKKAKTLKNKVLHPNQGAYQQNPDAIEDISQRAHARLAKIRNEMGTHPSAPEPVPEPVPKKSFKGKLRSLRRSY
jgi:hypothetical protein